MTAALGRPVLVRYWEGERWGVGSRPGSGAKRVEGDVTPLKSATTCWRPRRGPQHPSLHFCGRRSYDTCRIYGDWGSGRSSEAGWAGVNAPGGGLLSLPVCQLLKIFSSK